MTKHEKILDKIQKLLAKANNTSNDHEAIAFMEKAHDLLAEHNLSITEVEGYNPSSIEFGRAVLPDTRCYPWHRQVWANTAKLFFCKYYYTRVKGHRYNHTLAGQEHNCIAAQHMAVYLVTTIRRLAKEATDNNKDNYAFEQGCARRVCRRLYDKYQESTQPSISNPSNLPALYSSELDALDKFLKAVGVNLVSRRSSLPRNQSNPNYGKGAKAGESISLDSQITSSSTPKHKQVEHNNA